MGSSDQTWSVSFLSLTRDALDVDRVWEGRCCPLTRPLLHHSHHESTVCCCLGCRQSVRRRMLWTCTPPSSRSWSSCASPLPKLTWRSWLMDRSVCRTVSAHVCSCWDMKEKERRTAQVSGSQSGRSLDQYRLDHNKREDCAFWHWRKNNPRTRYSGLKLTLHVLLACQNRTWWSATASVCCAA